MRSVSVSSCRYCIYVYCVHPVAVLNAAFCMTCSLLMLVEDARGILQNRSHDCIVGTTNVEHMYLLSGIAPPAIRRDVCARVETDQINRRDSLSGQIPAARRIKPRHGFLSSVQPANFPEKFIRCSEWRKRMRNKVSKRHSLQAVELSKQKQTVVQIVSNLPAPSNGGPI